MRMSIVLIKMASFRFLFASGSLDRAAEGRTLLVTRILQMRCVRKIKMIFFVL